MADRKIAPVESVADINRRNLDFYAPPSAAVRRRPDGTVVDELFARPEDDKFRWPDGRRPG